MVSLAMIVKIVIYLLVAGAIIGLLFWLIRYCERKFPTADPNIFNIVRIVLVILVVLLIIGMLLSLINDRPLFI